MRGLFSKACPSFERLLVIESGPRDVAEIFLQHLYEVQKSSHVDLLSCYGGRPQAFDPERGTVYSVHDAAARQNRGRFIRQLLGNRYTIVAILCTGDPVLAKWKWIIALRAKAKILIVNEHAGFFLLDFQHHRFARMMLSLRLGVHQPFQLRLVGELLLMPFTIGYLALYAAYVHARRVLRTG
jgi:hypothetical protein